METLSLARRLELGPMPPGESTRVMARIIERVSEWHARGVVHRRLSSELIALGASSDEIEVEEPSPEPVLFGGPHWDPEKSPAEFSAIAPDFRSAQSSEAQTAFATQKLKLDPTQLDLYQLGVLFTRLLTGEGATAYLSSPKTKARVPENWRPLLDRALGCSRAGRLESAADFAQALRETEIPPQIGEDASNANRTASSIDRPIPFARIGEYEIRGRLGHGGMGDVYKAVDDRRNQLVAVKVLPDELARHADFVRRFYAEAAAAAQLQHPHIVEILFVGDDQGRHFFVMEYVAGESLAECLARQRSLPVSEGVDIICQVLSGLSAAHSEGMVHRDIKPGNILLDTARRRAVLTDFGLVKSLQESTGLTATGVVVGSVQYISPEQARGRPVDARSDLYSLGVLLYQMLSGELPFTGDGATALIFQHVYEPPRPLIEVAPDISPVLGVIVDKLLAKAPEERYASAKQVTADLRAFVNRQPLPSGADIIEDEEGRDPAGEFERPLDGTMLIAAPRFEPVPSISLPEEPVERAPADEPTWWERLRRGSWRPVSEHAPAFARSLQSTGQQVDSAVAEYERQQRGLQQLTRRALQLLQELRQQRTDWQSAAERTRSAEEQQRCQHNFEELTRQIVEQQEQLSAMRLQQAKVLATLERLRNQRDILRARLKVAEATMRLAGWKRRRRTAVSLMAMVAVLCVLASVWIVLDRPRLWNSMAAVIPPEQKGEPPPMPFAVEAKAPRPPAPEVSWTSPFSWTAGILQRPRPAVCGGADGRLQLWNLSTGRPVDDGPFRNWSSGQSISGLCVLPDTNEVVSWERLGSGSTVQRWAADLKGAPQHFDIKDVSNLLPTNDRNIVFVVRAQQTKRPVLELYDLAANAPLQQIADDVNGVSVSLRAEVLAYYSPSDKCVHVWSMKSRRQIGVSARPVNSSSGELILSPDGKLVAIACPRWKGTTLQIIDVESGELQFEYSLRGMLRDWAFQPGTELLAVANEAEVELWDLRRQLVRQRFQAAGIAHLSFSGDGRTLAASGLDDGKPFVDIWDATPPPLVRTGGVRYLQGRGPSTLTADGLRYASMEYASQKQVALVLRELENDREVTRVQINESADSLRVSRDGRFAAISVGKYSDDCPILIVDLEAGEIRQRFQGRMRMEFGSGPVLYFGQREDFKTYHVETGEVTTLAPGVFANNCTAMAVSPDEEWLAVGSYAGNQMYLTLTNLRRPEDSRPLPFFDHGIRSIRFSPDGKTLAVVAASKVIILNVDTGEEIRRFRCDAVGSSWGLEYSPDGTKIVTAGHGVSVWEAATGDPLWRFAIQKIQFSLSEPVFAPDGQFFVTSQPGNYVLLFDCAQSNRGRTTRPEVER